MKKCQSKTNGILYDVYLLYQKLKIMKNWITKTLLTAVAVFFIAYILPGVTISGGVLYAIIVALIINLLNSVVKPILVVMTLPATILTLGLFMWVINAVVILMADYFLDGFVVNGFWWALLFGALLSGISSYLQRTFMPNQSAKKSFNFSERRSINSESTHTTETGNKVSNEGGKKTIIIEKD